MRNIAKKGTEPTSASMLKETIQRPFLAKMAAAHHEDELEARVSRSSPEKARKLLGKIAESHLGEIGA